MPDPAALLEFQIDVASWRRIASVRARLERAAQMALSHLPKRLRFPITATVLLTGNAKLKRLNHDFRGINKPTNVLSFPQFTRTELHKLGKGKQPVAIGDIALGYQYVVAESKKEHKILINHITHLVIHGLLHNFGYDHQDEGEAAKMESLEIKIMKALGLPDPYAELMAQKTAAGRHKRK